MLNKLISFRENILLFSLGCYALGFIHMISYYYIFNIPIVFYVNFNDILLFALTTILPTILVLFVFEIIFMIIIKEIINFILKSLNKNELSPLGIHNYTLYIVAFCLLFLTFDSSWNLLKARYQFLIFISLSLIVARNVDYNSLKEVIKNGIMFILLIGMGIFVNCKNTLNGNTSTDVEFLFHEKYIQSGHYTTNLYIGETSSTLFMYNTLDFKTTVYAKEEVSDLVYSDRLNNEKLLEENIKFTKIENIVRQPSKLTLNVKNEWYTNDSKIYFFRVEQNVKGMAILMRELNDLLNFHHLNYNFPFKDNSFISKSLDRDFEYDVFNKACKEGIYEIEKWWTNDSYFMCLSLDENQYFISYHVANKNTGLNDKTKK